MMQSPAFEATRERLGSKKNIVILAHSNPDGDAMGASLGLWNYLIKKGHDARVIVPNEFPSFLAWMPGCEEVGVFDREKALCTDRIEKAEIIFLLDFNTLSRIGDAAGPVKSSGAWKVMIDHHQQPDPFPDLLYHDVRSSSTAELVYNFICSLGDESLLDERSGICLYTGIMTDTASFRFPSAGPQTLRIAARLKEMGVKTWLAHENVYDTNSEDRLKLMGYALSEKMVVLKDVKTAYITLSRAELDRFRFRRGDTEGLVNWCLAIDGMKLGVFFMEKENEIKVSLRSKGAFDVNAMARKHFNGGGHINAAGGSLPGTLDNAVKKLLEVLPLYRNELNT